MNFEEMSIEEIKNEFERLKEFEWQANQNRFNKFICDSDRAVFKYISPTIKKNIFDFDCDRKSGKIIHNVTESRLNDNFKKFYVPVIRMLRPVSETYPSMRGKYQFRHIGFNEWTDEEYEIVKQLILDITSLINSAKIQMDKIQRK